MFSKKLLSIFVISLVCLGTFFLTLFAAAKKSLEVSIVMPGNDNEKRFMLYESSDKIIFHVLVKNVSDQEVRIWKDWNSWGYKQYFFPNTNESGKYKDIQNTRSGME